MVVVVGGVDGDDAAGAGDGAAHVLELNGGVVDVKAVAEHMIQVVQDVVAL
jgi:hypothetical protein